MGWIIAAIIIIVFLVILKFTNVLSYTIMKNRELKNRKWDLNICCGKTDGGGINADIIQHSKINNFNLIKNIYDLPYADKQFEYVICSHTMEHIDNPTEFYSELERVGKNLTILIPPLWDLSAAFNFLEHKWVFLSLKTKHSKLPKFVKLPISDWQQKKFGQKIKA